MSAPRPKHKSGANHYFAHSNSEVQNGIRADYRTNLAQSLLMQVARTTLITQAPEVIAATVFSLAEAFVKEGEERGWILPAEVTEQDLAENNISLQHHARRYSERLEALGGGGRKQ